MFMNIEDAINFLENKRVKNERKNLDKMNYALKLLSHPERAFKSIHIAGTNGKGSTALFIKSILYENGYKVGTFISPYIVSFNERIANNNSYITNDELLYYINKVCLLDDKIVDKFGCTLSFFEMVTLIAFLFFKDKEVQYAVIEVGLGGRFDATNIINASCSIITNIGFDHMNFLGNTIEDIALAKLGIIKKGNHLITAVKKELQPLFTEYCHNNDATVEFINEGSITIYPSFKTSFVYDNEDIDLEMIGPHQAYNAYIAIKACYYLEPTIPIKRIKIALLNTVNPGRLEIVSFKPRIILDGAHNIDGIESLCKTIEMHKLKPIFVMSILKDKEPLKMIQALEKYAKFFVFTEFDDPRAIKAKKLYDLEKIENKQSEEDFKKAILKAKSIASKNDTIIITGSLHFISAVRKCFK